MDRNRGAEQKADHPRRGFQFPDLRLKSTRRLDERRPGARILSFFLKSRRIRAAPAPVILTAWAWSFSSVRTPCCPCDGASGDAGATSRDLPESQTGCDVVWHLEEHSSWHWAGSDRFGVFPEWMSIPTASGRSVGPLGAHHDRDGCWLDSDPRQLRPRPPALVPWRGRAAPRRSGSAAPCPASPPAAAPMPRASRMPHALPAPHRPAPRTAACP